MSVSPLEQAPTAYLLVEYPRWVSFLRGIVSWLSKQVFQLEIRTAKFYDLNGKPWRPEDEEEP